MPAPETEAAEVLRLRGVVKHYDRTRALDGLNLSVRAGEAVALVGPSGCGKTTALKLLNGLLRPDRGTVEVDGLPLEDRQLVEHRRGTGYVIQEGGLLPHWTVAKNIATVLVLQGQSRSAIERRVVELLEAVGLEQSLADKKPAQLSGGQRQRVGIARALAARPRFLLMDEPFGALDPLNRARLRRLVKGLRQQSRASMVLVTHDLRDAQALADRLCVMRQGRLVETLAALDLNRARDPWVREFLTTGADGALA